MITNNRYIDVNLDFKRNPFNNDVYKAVDLNSIQQSVLNISLTSKGEKPFDYDYGVGVYRYLFELIESEDISDLASEFYRQLRKYEELISKCYPDIIVRLEFSMVIPNLKSGRTSRILF